VKTALIQNQNEPYHDCQNYSFSLSGNDPNACLPDSFEPNNMRRDSSSIEAGNYNLTLCEGDIDWFTIRLDTYTQLFVTTEAGNKMELYLLGQNTPISTSEITSDGSEILSYTNNDPNNRSIDVMLKVFKSDINTDSSIFDYSLDVQIYYID
jgi:hypothetical protein